MTVDDIARHLAYRKIEAAEEARQTAIARAKSKGRGLTKGNS